MDSQKLDELLHELAEFNIDELLQSLPTIEQLDILLQSIECDLEALLQSLHRAEWDT